MTSTENQIAPFLKRLHDSVSDQSFIRVVLSNGVGVEPDLKRITVRQIQLRGDAALTFVSSYKTRDITKNYSLDEGIGLLDESIGSIFKHVLLTTNEEEVELSAGKKGGIRITSKSVTQQKASEGHDREKERWLSLDRPFLTALGVTTAQHQLIPSMSRKWKQINKFIEVFSHALSASPLANAKQLTIADFGSGKGYLTFAIHDWLKNSKGLDAKVIGVELRPDMVELCNKTISNLGIEGLHIEQGDVRSYTPQSLNVMIALHACDTATDYAIHLGLRAGAEIIMCSPCCHKQIRPQMHAPQLLQPLLQHGVHLGQESEMLTDGLRALLLEACGYDTQIFEFISLEHTNKNKMILAVKRSAKKSNRETLAQIEELKKFYGIREQALEMLLQQDRLLA
jgi:Methyltransferase domain